MKIKLKVEWPSKTHWQVLASRRLKEDPMSEAGWWIGMMGDELVMGWGRPFGDGHCRWRLRNASEYIFIEEELKSLAVCFDGDNWIGLMSDLTPGDELHLGFDPQQPWAKWEGKVEIVGDDDIIGSNYVPQNNPIETE
jgi:hypothetical protein